jgi:hypothetical protein
MAGAGALAVGAGTLHPHRPGATSRSCWRRRKKPGSTHPKALKAAGIVPDLRKRSAVRSAEDRGQMLPGGIDAGWEVTPETMAP